MSQDNAQLCWTCCRSFGELLGSLTEWRNADGNPVPGLVEDLEITLSKQDRVTPPGGGKRRKGEHPLPVRLDVPGVTGKLGGELTSMADRVAKHHGIRVDASELFSRRYRDLGPIPNRIRERTEDGGIRWVSLLPERCTVSQLPADWCAHCAGLELPLGIEVDTQITSIERPRNLVAAGWFGPSPLDVVCFAAKWMREHLGELRALDDAVNLVDRVTDAIDRAQACIDIPQRPNLVGRCEGMIDTKECGAALYAEDDATIATCEQCGNEHSDLSALKARALKRMRLYPATALEISRDYAPIYDVTITDNQITVWANRGKLKSIDTDSRGTVRYRIGDVLDLVDARERKRRKGKVEVER